MPDKLLIPREKYLASGIHIGMKQRTKQMKDFIYKIRPDGLAVLNLKQIDERIRFAGQFLARLNKILVVGRKSVSHDAIEKFGEATSSEVVVGRFLPGTLTNPKLKRYFEAEAIIIIDPLTDYQALKEAVKARVPIVGIADTFNETRDLDLIIPANNKSKKSLGVLFWLLAREILKNRKRIKSDSDFEYKIEDFAGEKF